MLKKILKLDVICVGNLTGKESFCYKDLFIKNLLSSKFVQSFIDFSKPLIAIVNGPAIGISFTVLGLFDMVITSDRAKFSAPFTQKALSPEGCSSYTFPKLMGRIKVICIKR